MQITIDAIDDGWVVTYIGPAEYPRYGDILTADVTRMKFCRTPKDVAAFILPIMKKLDRC